MRALSGSSDVSRWILLRFALQKRIDDMLTDASRWYLIERRTHLSLQEQLRKNASDISAELRASLYETINEPQLNWITCNVCISSSSHYIISHHSVGSKERRRWFDHNKIQLDETVQQGWMILKRFSCARNARKQKSRVKYIRKIQESFAFP